MTSARGLAALVLLCGCGRLAEGTDAYREGRFRDAYRAFAAAEERAGSGASAELLHDEALAALRAGELRAAESAAERAAGRGGPEFEALRDFVKGSVAFARGEAAAAQARTPEAEPFAIDVAIAHAESARRAWQLAAASRADWPAARRNVERAHLLLQSLREEKARRDPKKRSAPDARPRPIPAPRAVPEDRAAPKPDGAGPEETELAPGEVLRLFEKLAEKEREKLALRRARQEAQPAGVTRDW